LTQDGIVPLSTGDGQERFRAPPPRLETGLTELTQKLLPICIIVKKSLPADRPGSSRGRAPGILNP
jgi:hypothetical protein